MTVTTSNFQTTIVDYAESGKFTKEMMAVEIAKYEALSDPSKKAIRKRFELCHEIFYMTFCAVLDGKKELTFAQYCDFRDIIQYFKDLETLS